MRRTAAASAIVAVIVLWAAPAMVVADDVFTLPWDRTDPRTTTQVWNFDASDTLNVPADDPSTPAFDNPNGTPVANLLAGGSHNANFQGRSGVWQVQPIIQPISFTVPTPVDPLAPVLGLLQVTWHEDGSLPTFAPPSGGNFDFLGTQPASDAGWFVSAYQFDLSSSPADVTVLVAGDNTDPDGSFIDQVIIDTLTVPAPGAATVMFACGMIALARRRHRRRH